MRAAAMRARRAAAPALRPLARSTAPLQQQRHFFNVQLPAALSGPGGPHITKYHIAMPGKDGVEYDDFLVALPERDQLASFSKEVPLFVRYLKTVTDKEGREDDLKDFVKRAGSGLVVESDVFITTDELLALMWKNGYSEEERAGIQNTFPSDYKFHYPELSVLFDIAEEDTYKFCMRTRIEASHIGALDWDKVKRKGWIRDHWMIFGMGIFIFKYFPFFNYYFGIKVFGTSMWCWTLWTGVNRWIAKAARRNEHMASQKTASEVMDGEDKIYQAMARFQNDAKCTDYLACFKDETEAKISAYKKALVLQMKDDLTDRATKQLQAIAAFEAGMGSALQDLVVREAASSFKEKFPTDQALQDKAFAAAVKSLGGQSLTPADDPVTSHFTSSLGSLGGVDLLAVKGDANGSLPERIAYAQQLKDTEFQETFMVTPKEVAEIRSIIKEAKSGADYDWGKLAPASTERLSALYASVNAKVGYAVSEIPMKPLAVSADDGASAYIDTVNQAIAGASQRLRAAQMTAFARAFE